MLIPMSTGLVQGVSSFAGDITAVSYDSGTRDDTNPTSYAATINFTTNTSVIYVVSRMKEEGATATRSLTISGGPTPTLVHRTTTGTGNEARTLEVWYSSSVSTGSTTVTSTGDGARSTAIMAFMLSAEAASTTADYTATSVSDGGSTGLKDIATVSTVAGEFVVFIQSPENDIDTNGCEIEDAFAVDALLTSPFDQARTGTTDMNMVILISDMSTGDRDLTGRINLTGLIGTVTTGQYIKVSLA